MGTYLMMLYVSLDQEEAVKDFFMGKGWCFKKPDLSVTTDKTGPLLIQDTAYTELRETVETNQTVTETVSDRKLKPAPKLRVTPKRSKRKVKAKASTGPKKTENAEFQDILHEAEIIAASINETETPEGEATATEVKVEQEYVVEYNDNSDEDNFDDYDDFSEQETDGVMPSTSEVQGASDAPAPSTSITTPTATKKRKLSGKGKDSKDAEEDEDLVAEETPIKTEVQETSPFPVVICNICFKTFAGKKSLNRHFMRCHTNKRPFTCYICGFSLKTKDELNKHENTHNPNIAHVCDKCGKVYRTKFSLSRHKLTHSDTCKYVCSKCGLKFKTPSSLNYHINYIHKDKPQCSKCGQSFMNIQSHIRVCGQRNRAATFDCKQCEKKFRSAKTLKEHTMYKHINPQRYVCKFCDVRFGHRSSMMYHKVRCPKRPRDDFWGDEDIKTEMDGDEDSG